MSLIAHLKTRLAAPSRGSSTLGRSLATSRRSQGLTGDPTKGATEEGSWEKMSLSRANLRALGWQDGDFRKPIVTIASPWSNANPCNYHHRELTDLLVDAIERRGGKAFVCGTPVISDGMTQGTTGMRYSLISRDLIADCIELMHEGYMADAMITLGGCDKTVPAAAMPLARTNAVGIMLYGGTAMPGLCEGCYNSKGGLGLDAKDGMEAIASYTSGQMTLDTFKALEANALPGPGTCSAMFTANTMSSAVEALGLSPPHTASHPATTRVQTLVDSEGGGGSTAAAAAAAGDVLVTTMTPASASPATTTLEVTAQKRRDVEEVAELLLGAGAGCSGGQAGATSTASKHEGARARKHCPSLSGYLYRRTS